MHRHEDDQEFEGPGFVGGPRGFRGPVRRGPRGPFRGGPDFFGRYLSIVCLKCCSDVGVLRQLKSKGVQRAGKART